MKNTKNENLQDVVVDDLEIDSLKGTLFSTIVFVGGGIIIFILILLYFFMIRV